MVALATVATIIASQALISGVYSITRQATSSAPVRGSTSTIRRRTKSGQIYVPTANWPLIACIMHVLGSGTSNLAAAYGIAVTLTMVVTAVLLHAVALERWKWPAPAVYAVTALFLTMDVTFLGANC